MKSIEKPYKFFDVTADIGFYAFGNTLEESFENAAIAMFNIISNTDNIKPTKKIRFTVESEDKVSLLYDFLEEILFYHEVEFMLFSKFTLKINKIDERYILDALIKGEDINWNVHERGSEVKAITFHQMEVNENKNYYEVKAILDL